MASMWANKKNFSPKGRAKAPRISDLINILELRNGEFYKGRLIGPPLLIYEHWIKIRAGKENKIFSIRKRCLDNSPDESAEPTCPYCTLLEDRPRLSVLANFIDRRVQRAEPRKLPPHTAAEKKLRSLWAGKDKMRFKSLSSESWTPVIGLKLPTTAARLINDLTLLNTRTSKKTGESIPYGPEHPKYGFDINIKYDKDADPSSRYKITKAKRTQLTEEELNYLIWNLDQDPLQSVEEATKDAKSLGSKLVITKKDKNGKEVDVDAPIDFGEGPSKSRRRDDDEDGLGDLNVDDFSDDEDQQDDEPRRKKSKSKKSKKSKKSRSYDLDDEQQQQEDDYAPKRSKKKKAKKKRSRSKDYEDSLTL